MAHQRQDSRRPRTAGPRLVGTWSRAQVPRTSTNRPLVPLRAVPPVVDFNTVSLAGLEESSFPEALAGLRAHEARYFKTKFGHDFETFPAAKAMNAIQFVDRVLAEREISIESPPLETTTFEVENIRWTFVFYQNGLEINVLYTLEGPAPKRAVGFKLSEGMEIPSELSTFKFARQKSKLAGTIRGSFFIVKGEYSI